MKNPLLYTLLVIGICFNLSCTQQASSTKSPVKVILDTDMGSDCDDVGALALLHEYAFQGKVEILGIIYSSGAVPYGAGIIDAINRYYGKAELPIGANYEPSVGDTVDKMQAEKLAKDTAAFGNQIIHNRDAIEQTRLLRKLLSQAADSSVVYISIGHTKGIYDLLTSQPDSLSVLSGQALVAQKIDKWIALGGLHATQGDYHAKDWNFFFNGTAPYTKYVVEHFPRPIYFISGGSKVMTGKSLIHTPKGNIVRTAYRDWLWEVEQKTLVDQRPSWDLLAVYYAVEKPEKYFEILSKGYLEVKPEQGARWIASDSSVEHFYVQLIEGYEAELSAYLNAQIAAPAKAHTR